MNKKINLKAETVLNKKFRTEISGYSPREVDQYLDLILEDYHTYESLIELKDNKMQDLKITIKSLNEEIERLNLDLKNQLEQLKKVKATKNIDLVNEIRSLKNELKSIKGSK